MTERLERDAASALQMLGLVHRAHAAASEFAHDTVAAADRARLGQFAHAQGIVADADRPRWLRHAAEANLHQAFRTETIRRILPQRLLALRTSACCLHVVVP